MNKAQNIIQLVTSLSVLIGLGLVIYELRQTRELTLLQLAQGSMTEMSAEQYAIYGESAAVVLRKACMEPDSLTDDELFVLDAYFRTQVFRVMRFKQQEDIAGFNWGWRSTSESMLRRIVSFPQGKRWLTQNRLRDREINALIDEVLVSESVRSCDRISVMKEDT